MTYYDILAETMLGMTYEEVQRSIDIHAGTSGS